MARVMELSEQLKITPKKAFELMVAEAATQGADVKEEAESRDCGMMDLMEEVEGLEELEQAMLEELMLLGWDYSHSPLY